MAPKTHRPPLTYWTKTAVAVGLIVIADALLYAQPTGVGLGIYGLVLSLAVVAVFPALRRDPRALIALTIAAVAALLQLERPTLTLTACFFLALGVAVLSPRAPARDDVWPWTQRVGMGVMKGLIGPFGDLRRLRSRRLKRRPGRSRLTGFSVILLPLAGGLAFLTLFAAANPLIGATLAKIRLPNIEFVRSLFWLAVGIAAWGVLRPRGLRRTIAPPDGRGDLKVFGVTPSSLTLSLIVFNALFALQNGLDVAFLWSHAPLPEGVTLADYAHRGAYLLIVTAILAGAFVLVALRPGSTTAGSPLVRRLVVLFVGQNLLLVASSALRTLDYVEAYGLTRLRIAALAWMALVAVGLVLVCVRLLRDKSSSWLINGNALAAGLLMLVCALVDLGAVAATWNARNAREVNGHGPRLDLCYLQRLGGSALVPLVELEGRPLPQAQSEAVRSVRESTMVELARGQANWRTWSWRGARRLEAAMALASRHPASKPVFERRCDGSVLGSLETAQPARPLTSAPQPGT